MVSREDPLAAFRRRNGENPGFVSAIEKIKRRLDLSGATACVSIGAGTGEREAEFFTRMMPNIRHLTAVEPDSIRTAQLKQRLSERFPELQVTVCHKKVQDWNGPDSPVDVVVLFHVIQFFTDSERRMLFRRLFQEVLSTGGLVLTLCECYPSESLDMFQAFGVKNFTPPLGVLERDMLDVGFEMVAEERIDYIFDITDIEEDDASVDQLKLYAPHVTREFVRHTLRQISRGEDQLHFNSRLSVFQVPRAQ